MYFAYIFYDQCDAYHVSISHVEYLLSIDFYKDGNKLPQFLLNYDSTDFLEQSDRRDRVLLVDTHEALFDTIVLEKMSLGTMGAFTGMIEVYDDLNGKLWTGTFGDEGEEALVTVALEEDFVTAAPLDTVHVVDTMQ